jgi:K+-sensing histidine kinase KdpD
MICGVICAAWFGGFGPGLLAIALSLFAMHYYLVPPINSFALKKNFFAVDVSELPRLALFLIAPFVNFAISALKRAKEAQRRTTESLRRFRDDLLVAIEHLILPQAARESYRENQI